MRGQGTIMGIIMVFITLIVLTAVWPTIIQSVGNATATPGIDDASKTLWNLIPFAFPLAILMSLLIYASVQREPGY